ncbi:LuxR C-terminal-related transcriptional regulator [Parasphingorhabdus sp.]|jgi:LuxR family maltose regulon positive regulatory protein|uniref:LuxR C-terminal-related transcriptional regulator n=1 Tax=Parasphingorhabdus sp. TaxID=2709688 RepID=UPI003D2850FA
MTDEEDIGGEGSWIVASKFVPSKPNINLVDRARLIEKLETGLSAKAIFLVAPAGFGKSTVLCQWFDAQHDAGDIFGWLSLDEADCVPEQFLAYITLSLAEAGGELGQFEAAARNGFPDSRARVVLSSLMRRIGNWPHRCVLILDDMHLAASPEIDGLLDQMIRESPVNFTLVLNSRSTPSVDLPGLVAAGDAIEIGAEQLRLTQAESKEALGVKMEEKVAREIFELTEGWPVAVQLARVQKQAQPDAAFHSGISSSLIASYLTKQVLDTLEPDVREFLLEMSVLEQFNASLADAVRGSRNSLAMLRELEAFDALLVPTDSAGGWTRLHHLVAEYLRENLLAEAPGRAIEIYHAASAWFETEGQLISAVRYARLAEDEALVERLILDGGGWSIILTAGINVMRTLLRLAPEHLVSSSARLMVAKSYLYCKDGKYKEARGLLDASGALGLTSSKESYDRDRRLVGSMIGAYEDKRDWTVQTAVRDMPGQLDDWTPLEAGTLLCEAVIALFSTGELDRAHENLELAFREMRHSGSVLGLNYCYLHAATLALYRGKFDLAQANIVQALDLAENNFGSDSGLKRMAQVLEFSIRAWSGEIERHEIEELSNVLAHIEKNDGWTEIYIVGLDAGFAACEQHGELGTAAEFCERMLELAKRRNLTRLERHATILKMRGAYLRGHANEVVKIADDVYSWVGKHDLKTSARDWQNHFVAIYNLATTRMMSSSLAANAVRQCVLDGHERGATFFEIRLLVSEALLFWQLDKHERSISALREALELAAPQRIIGPFVGLDPLKPILGRVKADLSLKQESVLLANFVSQVSKRRRDVRPQSGNDLLSVREHEILEQLAQGHSNKEIARRFELTQNTVKFHLKNIYSKLEVNRRTQAIAQARQKNLID